MTYFLVGTAWTAFVAVVGYRVGHSVGGKFWRGVVRILARQVAQLLLAEDRRRKPLREANARRHAEALERKNQAKARTDALHAELRELTEGLI